MRWPRPLLAPLLILIALLCVELTLRDFHLLASSSLPRVTRKGDAVADYTYGVVLFLVIVVAWPHLGTNRISAP